VTQGLVNDVYRSTIYKSGSDQRDRGPLAGTTFVARDLYDVRGCQPVFLSLLRDDSLP